MTMYTNNEMNDELSSRISNSFPTVESYDFQNLNRKQAGEIWKSVE